jgi:hypothetical protein
MLLLHMDEIYFLVRFTPFWAVPILLISLEFAYLFWLRKKKRFMLLFLSMSLNSLVALIFYYWAGGPERSVKYLIRITRYLTD